MFSKRNNRLHQLAAGRLCLALATALALAACGGGGGAGGGTVTTSPPVVTAPPLDSGPPVIAPVVSPQPTVTLSANPGSIASGGQSTLTWASTDATACVASGGWAGSLATSGTQTVTALTSSTSYAVSCTGPGGTSATITDTVLVSGPVGAAPVALLSANPTTVAAGGAAVLTWSSTGATSCTASGAWHGTLAASGSQTTGAIAAKSTYSLTCQGSTGISPAVSQIITVAPAPSVTLVATPSTVLSGGTSNLVWNSSNATSCSASGGWSGALSVNGAQTTGALQTTTAYTVTCAGAAGTSGSATATVIVAPPALTVAPRTAAITLSGKQQFVATGTLGGTATWTVDGIIGGNSSVGTVSAAGLYNAGTLPGAHSVVATSVANTAQSGTATAAVTDLPGVYTYHNDLARDGVNSQEYALTTSNVNSAGFGKIASCAVDGAIYGQPLWVANVTVNSVKHNVVFVATQHDSLYAFDADMAPCVQLWSSSLIDTAHGGSSGETSVPGALVGAGYGDIQPEVGVTGTPVIDPVAGVLYVVAKSVNAAQTVFTQRLHAIDLATGNEKAGSPVTLAGTYPGTGDGTSTVTFNARQELQRPGLALINGVVYIAWAAHEDAAPYYGWMMGYQYASNTFTRTAILNVAPNATSGQGGGGIWMSGGAPAADANNHLYVLTGNGPFDATNGTAPNNDYGDSLLQMSTALTVSSYFTPSNQLVDAQTDKDFGAGGAAVLADLPAGNTVIRTLICGGKDGGLLVLNRDSLGGFGDAYVQKISLGHGIFATGAFWNSRYYLAAAGGTLGAYQLNTTTGQFSLANSSTHTFGWPGATPSVSAAAALNGIVWALDTHNFCTAQSGACSSAVLYAYDANRTGTELWNSTQSVADAAGYAVKFSVPTVANGKVYVGTRGNNIGGSVASTSVPGELDIYGLK